MKKYDPHMPHHMHIKDSLAPKEADDVVSPII
jgi:hypothetical protein